MSGLQRDPPRRAATRGHPRHAKDPQRFATVLRRQESSRACLRLFRYLVAIVKQTTKGGSQTRRFLELLNTPTAVLGVLVLVVVINGSLFFGYCTSRASSPSPSPPSELTQPKTTMEETTTPVTKTPPKKFREESPENPPEEPSDSPRETPTTTSTATATATATASP